MLLPRPPPGPTPGPLTAAVLAAAPHMTLHELSGLAWAAARLQLLPPAPIIRCVLQQQAAHQPQLLAHASADDVARMLSSVARLQQRLKAAAGGDSPLAVQHGAVALEQLMPLLDALLLALPAAAAPCGALGSVLSSLSRLGLRPPARWLAAALSDTQCVLSDAQPGALALLGDGIARLSYLPRPEWLAALHDACDAALKQKDHVSSKRELGAVAAALCRLSRLRRRPFPGQRPPAAVLDTLAAASMAVLPDAQCAGELAVWAGAMARLSSLAGQHWPGPSDAWWLALFDASAPLLPAAGPGELTALLHAAAVCSTRRGAHPPPKRWTAAWLAASQGLLLPSLERSDTGGGCHPRCATPALRRSTTATSLQLVQMGKALAALRVAPPQRWLQDWELALEASAASMSQEMRAGAAWARHVLVGGGAVRQADG